MDIDLFIEVVSGLGIIVIMFWFADFMDDYVNERENPHSMLGILFKFFNDETKQ